MILVLDLDDTLYDEAQFVDSGFAAVADMLAGRLDVPAATLHERMRTLLEGHGRGRVFDLLLMEQGIDDPELVAECVTVYRSHRPRIDLLPGVRDLLDELSATVPLYLVTDGDPDVQQRKIDALGIEPLFRQCYRTWSYGRAAGKPSLHCFDLIRVREGVEWSDLVYVGDDPSKDFVSLRTVGSTTVRVHRGRCAHDAAEPRHDAALHVEDVTEVPAVLGLPRRPGD